MTFPYSKLARAFAPRVGPEIKALGHRFIPYGQVEMLCRPCGFVIWKCEGEAEAGQAVRDLGGSECPYDNRTLGEQIAEDFAAQGIEAQRATTENTGVVHESPVAESDAPNPQHPNTGTTHKERDDG